MRPAARSRPARRAMLAAVTALAIAALPAERFPALWLTALMLPAAFAYLVLRRLPLRPSEQALLAVLLQVVAILGCMQIAQPLEHLAAIGCTLLPPLTWLVLRSDPLDVLRGLFLAFCVLLIGVILGTPGSALILAFLATSVITLHVDTVVASREERVCHWGRPSGALRRTLHALSLAAASLVAFLVVLQALRALPTPRRNPTEPAPHRTAAARQVGLDDRFAFDDAAGTLLSMRADRLVAVKPADRHPLSDSLYLRCGSFDVAGLDHWDSRRGPDRTLRAVDGVVRVGAYAARRPERALMIDIIEPAAGFVFVPPGAFAIGGIQQLIGDPRDGVFRFLGPPAVGTRYAVGYHPTHADDIDDLPDLRYARLTEIGDDLRPWLPLFDEILAQPRVRREIEPMAVAAAIADVLQARCRYALREPGGPHQHALLNFIDGDREGYCMHFAAATAICLRRAGIPARIGVGLHGGGADPDDRFARVFGSQHAHAWVEVPFEALGWVVFDPTPPAARAHPRWPDLDLGGAGGEVAEATTAGAAPARFAERLSEGWPWALGLALVWVVGHHGWRRSRKRSDRRRGRDVADHRGARRALEELLAELRQRGWPRASNETLEAFARRLRGAQVGGEALDDAIAAYQDVRFGGHPFDDDRQRRIRLAPVED